MTDREYIQEKLNTDLSDRLWDIVSDACSDYDHPQAVSPIDDAVSEIIAEVSYWIEENLK